jgi:hypothetical protein
LQAQIAGGDAGTPDLLHKAAPPTPASPKSPTATSGNKISRGNSNLLITPWHDLDGSTQQFGLHGAKPASKNDNNKAQNAVDRADLKPVANFYSAPSMSRIHDLLTDGAFIRESGDCELAFGTGNAMNLYKGEILVSTSKATSIAIGDNAKVDIAADSIVAITNRKGVITVRNLYDEKSHAVKVLVHNYHAHLPAGRELILHHTAKTPAQIMGNDGYGRRHMHVSAIDGTDKSATVSEVSLVTLLQNHPVIGTLTRASSAGEKELLERITRMAACIHTTGSGRGAYSAIPSGK